MAHYKFDNNIKPSERVLLILDGHVSRLNVLGLSILKASNVDAFTLLSHTPHVCQMFDVPLAFSFKRAFGESYDSYYSNNFSAIKPNLHWQRLSLIHAVRDAWAKTATLEQFRKSGDTAGCRIKNVQELEPFSNNNSS